MRIENDAVEIVDMQIDTIVTDNISAMVFIPFANESLRMIGSDGW